MADEKKDGPGPDVEVLVLKKPVQFTDSILVEELTMRRTAKAFRDFTLPMQADGTIMFQPYALAKVGVRLAAHPDALVDKLDPADMWQIAQVVMGFITGGPMTGDTPSP